VAAAGAHVYVENGRRTYAPLLSETTTLLSETHTPALSHVGCSPTDRRPNTRPLPGRRQV